METADFHRFVRGRSECDVDSNIGERICILLVMDKRDFKHFELRYGAGGLRVIHFDPGAPGLGGANISLWLQPAGKCDKDQACC